MTNNLSCYHEGGWHDPDHISCADWDAILEQRDQLANKEPLTVHITAHPITVKPKKRRRLRWLDAIGVIICVLGAAAWVYKMAVEGNAGFSIVGLIASLVGAVMFLIELHRND